MKRCLNDNNGAAKHHDQGQPKWEESAPRPVWSPPEAKAHGIEENDPAQQHQHRGRDDFRGAHPIS
jgi:hypothetical protein